MVSIIVIPIIIVTIAGLAGYLAYRYLISRVSSRRAVYGTLRRYNIDKTPSQIIREYYAMRGQQLSEKDIRRMENDYMRTDPDQFLSMYDEIRTVPRERSTRDQERDARRSEDSSGDDGTS